jgi:Predicted membrane protein (DUF2232)
MLPAKPTARLSAIEIAEGALLADVAVIFQVIWMFVPFVGIFFRLLIPIVFTILCLRRGLYAGIIALCAAIFLAAVVTGPNIIDLIYLLLEGIGGLYLGITMRRRASHLLILTLGTIGLTLALYAFTFFIIVVLGTPLHALLASLHRDYLRLLAASDLAATRMGVGHVWRTQIVPIFAPIVEWAFRYWWLIILGASLANAVPIMIVMYYITNIFVRVLGYDVRPFPGGWYERRRRKARRRLLRVRVRRSRMLRTRGSRRKGPPLRAPAEQKEQREETPV